VAVPRGTTAIHTLSPLSLIHRLTSSGASRGYPKSFITLMGPRNTAEEAVCRACRQPQFELSGCGALLRRKRYILSSICCMHRSRAQGGRRRAFDMWAHLPPPALPTACNRPHLLLCRRLVLITHVLLLSLQCTMSTAECSAAVLCSRAGSGRPQRSATARRRLSKSNQRPECAASLLLCRCSIQNHDPYCCLYS